MDSSQSIYHGIATTLSKQAISLEAITRRKSERIAKIDKELLENKFARPLVSVTAFQPPKSMDPNIVTTLRTEEATAIAALEVKLQQLRLAALKSDYTSTTTELKKFNDATELKSKIVDLLPILKDQNNILAPISQDIAIRISNYQSERARRALAAGPAPAQPAQPAAAPMAVDQPVEALTLASLQAELQEIRAAMQQLQQSNDHLSLIHI
jgi:hypothetical protein